MNSIEGSGTSDPSNTSNADQALINFRKALGLSSNTRIKITNKTQSDDSEKIYVSFVGEYPVKSPKLSEEILVSTPLSAELRLDREKKLVNYRVLEPDTAIIETMTGQLNNLVEKGKIKFPDKNEKKSLVDPIEKRTEFYIEKDDEGKLHLRRSHISAN